MTRYEDARDNLFEQKIDLLLIEWIERWIDNGGKEEDFSREVLRRVSRANQIRKGKSPVEAMGTPLPTFVDDDESQVSVGLVQDAESHYALAHRILNEQGQNAGANKPTTSCPAQPISDDQIMDASISHSPDVVRSENDQGQGTFADGPSRSCPGQQPNGLDQQEFANGRTRSFQPVTHREPTQGQIDAMIRARQAGAKTLFDKLWCGKPIGDHSWYSLSAINRESRAFLDELGPIPEGDKHRSLRELFCHDENKLRRAMRSAGMRTAKAA